MKNIFYQTEDGHLFDYEDIVALLTFEIRKLIEQQYLHNLVSSF